MNFVDVDPTTELDPIAHRRLHETARHIVAMYGDILGLDQTRRPTGCIFDTKPAASTPLGRYMRQHIVA